MPELIDDVPDDEPASVWVIMNNDDADDPAFGMEPLVRGRWGDVRAWLRAYPTLDQLSVTTKTRTFWAGDAHL